MGKILKGKNEDSLEYKYCKIELSNILESDLKDNNPDKIIDKYFNYLSQKKFQKIKIEKGRVFYRGRIGKMTLQGSIDDYNTKFNMPYYGDMINVPPPLYTLQGGRFNRAGVSYLYLATDVETCLAEVHLQVGQECSVGKFECINDIELINLSDFGNDLELKIWYELITQPIHSEIKYKYFITQFISEVLMKINSYGLYFKSVQSNGYNIVCFKPENFKPIKYSEKIYKAEKINYEYKEVKDDVRIFAERNDANLISDLNTDFVEINEKQIKYLVDWIDYEKGNLE